MGQMKASGQRAKGVVIHRVVGRQKVPTYIPKIKETTRRMAERMGVDAQSPIGATRSLWTTALSDVDQTLS